MAQSVWGKNMIGVTVSCLQLRQRWFVLVIGWGERSKLQKKNFLVGLGVTCWGLYVLQLRETGTDIFLTVGWQKSQDLLIPFFATTNRIRAVVRWSAAAVEWRRKNKLDNQVPVITRKLDVTNNVLYWWLFRAPKFKYMVVRNSSFSHDNILLLFSMMAVICRLGLVAQPLPKVS